LFLLSFYFKDNNFGNYIPTTTELYPVQQPHPVLPSAMPQRINNNFDSMKPDDSLVASPLIVHHDDNRISNVPYPPNNASAPYPSSSITMPQPNGKLYIFQNYLIIFIF
jgi:hypothetical protein